VLAFFSILGGGGGNRTHVQKTFQ